MKTSRDSGARRAVRVVAAAALALGLLGCVAGPPARGSLEASSAIPNPATRPQRNVTGFGDALRCMDDLLLKFGTRDIAIAMEEVQDRTGGRFNAGTREMMVSAIADLSRRSRAVRLIAFGSDANNLASLLQAVKQQSPFKVMPQFGLRGAVTQFDPEIEARRREAGLALGPLLSFRSADERFSTAVAFDASIVRTSDMTLVPTAISKNLIVITRRESGVRDGTLNVNRAPSSALISKFGIAFSVAVSSQDAMAQSVRGIVDLALIEIVGRLAMVPYWRCLGTGDDHPDIRREIEDWFIVLERDEQLVAFVQEHLRNRRRYSGAADGTPSPEFTGALAQVRRELGLSGDEIDLALFDALVSDRVIAAPKRSTAGINAIRPGPEAKQAPTLALTPSIESGQPNQSLSLRVVTSSDRFVYCYRQSASGAIERIFPNRFRKDPLLRAGQPVLLPSDDAFALRLDTGAENRFACVASPIEIYNELPPKLRWGDFEKIGFESFVEMRTAFDQAANSPLSFVERVVRIQHK